MTSEYTITQFIYLKLSRMKKKNIACWKLDVTGRGQCLGDTDFDDDAELLYEKVYI